jgi:hypothetical protein
MHNEKIILKEKAIEFTNIVNTQFVETPKLYISQILKRRQIGRLYVVDESQIKFIAIIQVIQDYSSNSNAEL